MKKNLTFLTSSTARLWAVLIMCMLGINSVYGSDGKYYYYYAKVTANTANESTGRGNVYVSTSSASSESATSEYSEAVGQDPNKYGETTDAPSEAGRVTFYLYAKPADGYKFDGWSSSATRPDVFESTNPEWKTTFGASTTQGEQSTTDPGVTQNSGTASSGGTQYYYSSIAEHTIYAYFSEQVMSFDVSFVQPSNGSIKVDGTTPSSWPYILNTNTGELNATLVATPASNYRFWGWYTLNKDGSKNYLSHEATYNASFNDATAVYAEFCPSDNAIFEVAGIQYYDLNDANEKAVANGGGKITVVQDGVVPAGNYTIASGVTLLVPFEESNSFNIEPQVNTTATPSSRSVYRALTLNNGVNITVNGNICVNAMMALKMGYNGSVLNKYGLIDMKEGSHINLKNGSNCYVWGYIIGGGTITAESGATLHETFQFKHRGGTALSAITDEKEQKKVFPINQYYIQNIEVPVIIQKGAVEKVYTGVHNKAKAISIDFIGESGLFSLVGENAYLVKNYDVVKDRQVYSLYGDAKISSIVFGMSGFYEESKDYVLPITNNMTLNVESGTTTIEYETAILPDVEINVASGAVVEALADIYVYDSLNWKGAYAYANDYSKEEVAQIAPVLYRHGGLQYDRKSQNIGDAKIDVQGIIKGKIYTTEGGANIKSANNGIYTISGERGTAVTYQVGQDGTTPIFDSYTVSSAQLRNADGTFTPTIGAPAGTEISYANGHWGWVEIWKDTDNNVLTALNTYAKVDDASVQSWAGINIPAGKYGKWETEIDEAKQEVVHTAVIEDIASAETLDVLDEQSITINTDATVETTTIATTGKVSVPANVTLTTTDLVLGATPEESSEIIIESNEVAADNVYFDLTRGAGKVFKHHTWYAFSVPFQVDAAQILFDGQTMQYGQTSKKDDYDILYYDGSVRAAQGKAASCWKYVEKDDPTYLYPGKLYMIANTRRDVTTLRFTKVTGTDLLNTSVNVSNYASDNTSDANWNGIANPAVFHANMSGLGATEGKIWVYNPDADDPSNPYEEHNLTDNIILGQAFFAQTPDPQTLVVSPSTGSAVSVARRRAQAKEANKTLDRFQVTIAPAGEKATDNVIVRMDENKEEDKYIIGTDLVRMGMSTMRPQLWVDRYDEKLCVNVMAPVNEQASYPLGIFAPNDGEYQISVARQPDNETTLYLTLDGKVIWNLNHNPYTATLTKGNTDRYGLLMVGNKAPEIATGVDEAVVDANGATRKVLINNHIYIIRGDQVYTINGQKIR